MLKSMTYNMGGFGSLWLEWRLAVPSSLELIGGGLLRACFLDCFVR